MARDGEIDDHAFDALRGAGGEPDKREAHMADRAIGHQPLDIGLPDRGEGAEPHRGDGEEGHDLLPFDGDGREGRDQGANGQRKRGELGRCGEERGDGRRRAFIDVRRPHMEGHGGDLEGEARHQEHEPEDQAEIVAGRLHGFGDVA